MAYLLDPAALTTVFPRANAKDFAMQVRLIEEQYQRMYPLVAYSCLNKAVTTTSVTASGDRAPVGAAGTTKFDPIWGESVDPNSSTWQQPHATPGTVVATDTDQYLTPIPINARVQRINRESQLKKYGFDKVRDLTLFIPLSLLDRRGVTAQHNDKFLWSGYEYVVLDLNTSGYWKNSDIAMYMVLNCEQKRKGS